MGNTDQLVKKYYNSPSGYKDVNPATFTDAVKDRKTRETLESLISKNNFIYLSYTESKENTRLSIDVKFRRKGLWIGYEMPDKTIIVEYYSNDNLSDSYWRHSNNWIPYNGGASVSCDHVFDGGRADTNYGGAREINCGNANNI